MIDASYPSVETIDALFLVHKRRGSQRLNLPVRMEKIDPYTLFKVTAA